MIQSILLASILLFGGGVKHSSKKPLILVSVAPYEMLVAKIASTEIAVLSVVPEEEDPHSFEPGFSKLKAQKEALCWFQIQEPFEKKLQGVLQEKNPQMHFVDLSLPTTLSCCQGQDRHFWTDPTLLQKQGEIIYQTLVSLFPEKKDFFKKNWDELNEELSELDRKIASRLQGKEGHYLLVAHPAFGHFCRRYQLKQLSLEEEGQEPTLHHVQQISQLLQKGTPLAALYAEQHPKKGLFSIAQKENIPLYLCNPTERDFISMLESLSKQLGER